jgi:predicted transglutaminase-like cysteine proteinase
MVIIINMITISLSPYRFHRVILLLTLVASLISISCFASEGFTPVANTPYDHQMSRIQPVLCAKTNHNGDTVSLSLVNHWIQDLRAIPYGFSMEWKTPSEVESAPAADCKGKAVTLYHIMQAHGADNVRLVIGRRSWLSHKTHAWLEWTTSTGTYVLDPTINWAAERADRVGQSWYIPLYAYSGNHKYRASSDLMAASHRSRHGLFAAFNAPAAQ